MILVGTSGFRYRDWTPVFYPEGLDPKEWLRYYSRRFGCCELGFTCYRIPEAQEIQEIMEETRGALPLVFRAPLRLDNPGLARRFAGALWPLKETGQLAGVLVRFPPEFVFMRDNFSGLLRLRDSLEGIRLIAEFGSAGWHSAQAARHLAASRVVLACVDGVESPGAFRATTPELACVRFQGRRRSRWLRGDGSGEHDYAYSRAELESALPALRRLDGECERVLVFMNNPWRGQAAVNARMLIDILAATAKEARVPSWTAKSST
ncbi:MAG: DUF72 domain-containing protein [Acidobacteria bacterium]|nr:DUF72 domain-containing protein [Acidobacteriota bacterium]